MNINEEWLTNFQTYSPAFSIFSWLTQEFTQRVSWPDLNDYNSLTTKKIQSARGANIYFVEQGKTSKIFNEQYEPRIYLKGEVQTRNNNWHDFFNMLIWQTFPRIKSALNALQYFEIKQRWDVSKQRSARENFLTLFDENGILLLSTDEQLLELIRSMDWKTLFWTKRLELNDSLRCIVFGHSLHEKLLNPYIGMVGHGLLMNVSQNFFSKPLPEQLNIIEEKICNWLDETTQNLSPKLLHPVPILGFPNWFTETNTESFYDNQAYFRKKSSRG